MSVDDTVRHLGSCNRTPTARARAGSLGDARSVGVRVPSSWCRRRCSAWVLGVRGLGDPSLHVFSTSVASGATAGPPAPFPPPTPAVSPPASPHPSGEYGTGQGLPEPLGQAPWVGPGTSPVQVDVASSPAHPPAGLPGARVEVLGVGACGGPVGGTLPWIPSASQPPLLPRDELLEERVQEGQAALAPARGPLSAAGLLSRARSLPGRGRGGAPGEREPFTPAALMPVNVAVGSVGSPGSQTLD